MIDNEQVQEIFLVLEDKLDKTVSVLKEEFATVRAGRANPHILDKIQVEAYGGMSRSINSGISRRRMRDAL